MKEKLLALLLILFTSLLFSQENLHKVKLDLPGKTDSFQMIDNAKNELTLLTTAKDYIKLYKFNNDLKVIDSIITDPPKEEFTAIDGHSISNNVLKVFWSTADNKKIFSKSIYFTGKKTIDEVYNLTFEKEKIIKKITINNIFYIISTVKNSNILKFYIFPVEGKYEVKTVDFSNEKFYSKYNKKISLYDLLAESNPFDSGFGIKTISNETPASIVLAANKRKLYINDDSSITLSFDNNATATQLLNINLSDFSIEQKIIYQPVIDGQVEVNSNSFLINKRLIQLKLSSEKIIMSLKELDGKEVKEYVGMADTTITFKNSEIIQESGDVNDIRILEKSNQYIRKLYNSNPAITCFIKDNKYIVTVGSVGIVQNNSAAMYGGMFGVVGVLMAYALIPNTNLDNLNSYKNRKVVYVYGLFDKDFNHIEGEVKRSAFDTARKYSATVSKQTNLTLFKFNTILYIGSYDLKTMTYTFQGFTE